MHSFLLICHPYPPSFHEIIFILVPLIFLLGVAKLERQGAQKTCILTRTRARSISVRTYVRRVRADLCQVVSDWKAQRFSWPKGTSRESVESIYVKFMVATCLSEELGRLKKKKRGCLVSLADSRIECLRGRSAILNLRTVRVVALEYSQLHKKA